MKSLALLAALAVAGCSSTLPPRAQDQAAALKPAVAPALPQRNVTGFGDALRCMDNLYLAYGTRDVSVMLEDLTDTTKKVNAGTRDMMMSAISDMTRRSRALQVVAFGPDANNVVAFLNSAQQRQPFAVVPQYDLRGSITQLDEGVLRRQADAGVSAGTVLGAGASRSRQLNVLGLDVALVETRTLALVPGVVSKNVTTVIKEGDALDAQATISKLGINFSSSFQRTDGTAQALRNMVELSAVELFGKLLKLPYWRCLGLDARLPEIRDEIEDWFIGMDRGGELTPYFQLQLRNRGFYDGPVDGRISPALRRAVAAYRGALGLGHEPVVDLALFTRFIEAPAPVAPEQPFRDGGPEPARPAAVSATSAAIPAATPTAALPGSGGLQSAMAQPATAAIAPAAALLPLAASTRARPLAIALEPLPALPDGSLSFRVKSTEAAYVYCYAQDSTGTMQRIFPNRFAPDPLVQPSKPLQLPGAQGFRLPPQALRALGCVAAPREVYVDAPAALRWGDFQALNAIRSFGELQRIFEALTKAPAVITMLALPARP